MTALLSESASPEGTARSPHGDRIVLGNDGKAARRAPEIEIPGFDVTGFIARGGMSRVYRATERSSGRDVALKVVPYNPDDTDDASINSVNRLLSEGGLLAALSHPNLMPVYALGDADDWLYIAMTFAGGGDLGARIRNGVALADALEIAACMARALEFAAGHGLVHRDVKPGNVLFLDDGTPLLSDFGLAKPFGMEIGTTSVGMVLGSPEYMSPEQALGQELDGRTDIYSLGAMLFTMLTGYPPYRGLTQLKTIRMHLDEPVPELPHPHGWLQPLISRSMAKDPGARFADAGTMANALDKARHALLAASRRKQ